jgi:hypothetical protein
MRCHFEDRNPMLQLSLGAVSAARRFDRVLAEFCVPAPAASAPEALIDAVLGLIALRNSALAKLASAALTASHTEPDKTARSSARSELGESLLR